MLTVVLGNQSLLSSSPVTISDSGGLSLTDSSLPRVMFTGGVNEDKADTVRKLGGQLVDSVSHCTHLVTDKVRRTVKFLCCLSRGCTIVTTSWLDKCKQEGTFVPAEPFLVKDKGNERLHKFVLKDSLAKALSGPPLLQGWSVFVSENVKPCPKEMGEIIESSGGKVGLYWLTVDCWHLGSGFYFYFLCDNLFRPSFNRYQLLAMHCSRSLLFQNNIYNVAYVKCNCNWFPKHNNSSCNSLFIFIPIVLK